MGVPRLVPMSYMREALLEAGFEIETLRNHSDFGHALGGKHWDQLFDQFKSKFFLTTVLHWILRALERLSLISPLPRKSLEVMVACREGMVRGGAMELDIFSPMIFWLARKPEKRK